MTIYFGLPLILMLTTIFLSDNFIRFSGLSLKGKIFNKPQASEKIQFPVYKQLFIFLLLLSFFFSIYFFGFLPSIPLFMFIYLRFYARESWLTSVAISAATVSLVYIIFVYTLKLRL